MNKREMQEEGVRKGWRKRWRKRKRVSKAWSVVLQLDLIIRRWPRVSRVWTGNEHLQKHHSRVTRRYTCTCMTTTTGSRVMCLGAKTCGRRRSYFTGWSRIYLRSSTDFSVRLIPSSSNSSTRRRTTKLHHEPMIRRFALFHPLPERPANVS